MVRLSPKMILMGFWRGVKWWECMIRDALELISHRFDILLPPACDTNAHCIFEAEGLVANRSSRSLIMSSSAMATFAFALDVADEFLELAGFNKLELAFSSSSF